MRYENHHIPSALDVLGIGAAGLLLILTALGNADAMFATALLSLSAGIAMLPRRYWPGAALAAAAACAAALTFALVRLLP